MSHVPAPESTESDARPESGPVSDRDAQDAREAIYLSAVHSAYDTDTEVSTLEWDSRVAHLAMQAADAELAPLVARVAELEAEVERAESAEMEVWRLRRAHCDMVTSVQVLADSLRERSWISTDRDVALNDIQRRLRAALAAAGLAVSDGEGATSEAGALDWPFGLKSAAALIARCAWVNEPQQYQDQWSPRLIDEPDIRESTASLARQRFAAALAALGADHA